MRETETITEVEEVEREVERVYCDDCGSECSDDHGYSVIEQCPECSPDYSTQEKARKLIEKSDDDDVETTVGICMMAIVINPIVFWWALVDGLSDHRLSDISIFIASLMFGTIVWTAGLTALVVMFL